jgi:hypothetical protein
MKVRSRLQRSGGRSHAARGIGVHFVVVERFASPMKKTPEMTMPTRSSGCLCGISLAPAVSRPKLHQPPSWPTWKPSRFSTSPGRWKPRLINVFKRL